jgi:hypothetical protein
MIARHRLISPSIALIGAFTAGCELDDTVIPATTPRIAVQAVMRPDLPQQFVLVEQTFDGAIVPQRNVQPVPPAPLQTPVSGALVSVANLDLPADPCGASVRFDRGPSGASPSAPVLPGVYWSPPGCPTMRPGDRLELRVDVPNLGTVTGITRVPGLDAATLAVGGQVVAPGDSLGLNRDREALDLVANARYQRALQIVSYRVGTVPPGVSASLEDPTLSLMLFVDSTAATLPGTVRHVFARAEGDDAFRGGRRYQIVVGVVDTNYHDFVRTQNDEITGRGFANHLRGGIGVFGSLVAAPFVVNAVAELDDPREGPYDFTGTLQGVSINTTITFYLAPGAGAGEVSGFMEGTWLSWVPGPAGTTVPASRLVTGQSVDGQFRGDTLRFTIPTAERAGGLGGQAVRLNNLLLDGVRSASGPFAVQVAESTLTGRRVLGELTATKR